MTSSVTSFVWGLFFSYVGIAHAATENSLRILTSFPPALFEPFRTEFSRLYPDIEIQILNKKTSAAISYIQDGSALPIDVFWASAPDAFAVLKQAQKLQRYFVNNRGSPEKFRNHYLTDPDGYYSGFALSGYGMIWNKRYLREHGLPIPTRWDDLLAPEYQGHIGISAPSRSGTTHLIVEIILQHYGWQRGWAILLEMAGNFATITARSFGVPDGIRYGRFGVGLVIDFFGLTQKSLDHNIGFTYAPISPILPANIAMVKNPPHPESARAFIEFVLSDPGQELLFEPSISRLPIRQEMYLRAPAGYPNPFTQALVKESVPFNTSVSRNRYHLVNTLFDQVITFRLQDLSKTWKLIHQVEQLVRQGDGKSRSVLQQARVLASSIPVSREEAADLEFTDSFSRHKPGFAVSRLQTEYEAAWSRGFRQDLLRSRELTKGLLRKLITPNPVSTETVGTPSSRP